MQVLLQSRAGETEHGDTREEDFATAALPEDHTLNLLAEDLDRLKIEILALYKADLPPALIHLICRGARDQASIAGMLLDDCMLRAAGGTLTPKHVANVSNWIGGVRQWIERRQTAYAVNSRRKLCIAKGRR